MPQAWVWSSSLLVLLWVIDLQCLVLFWVVKVPLVWIRNWELEFLAGLSLKYIYDRIWHQFFLVARGPILRATGTDLGMLFLWFNIFSGVLWHIPVNILSCAPPPHPTAPRRDQNAWQSSINWGFRAFRVLLLHCMGDIILYLGYWSDLFWDIGILWKLIKTDLW